MNEVSRRRFLETATLAGMAGMSPLAAGAVASPPPLTRGWFAPFVGTTFAVRAPDGALAQLVLSALAPLPQTHGYPSAAHAAEWCFSAQFRSKRGIQGIGGLCEVEHPGLGTFTMMISPVGHRGGDWEAVFNRLKLA